MAEKQIKERQSVSQRVEMRMGGAGPRERKHEDTAGGERTAGSRERRAHR